MMGGYLRSICQANCRFAIESAEDSSVPLNAGDRQPSDYFAEFLQLAVTSAASVVIMGGGLLDPVKETSEVYFVPAIGGGL